MLLFVTPFLCLSLPCTPTLRMPANRKPQVFRLTSSTLKVRHQVIHFKADVLHSCIISVTHLVIQLFVLRRSTLSPHSCVFVAMERRHGAMCQIPLFLCRVSNALLFSCLQRLLIHSSCINSMDDSFCALHQCLNGTFKLVDSYHP